MKKVIAGIFLLNAMAAGAQHPVIQPLSSGDYWRIEEYNNKLRQFNYERNPGALQFPSGYAGIANLRANRLTGVNEIQWTADAVNNVGRFMIEYSRDNRTFERAGEVFPGRTEDGNRYVYRHPFNDNSLVYYRVALMNRNNNVVAYTPSVQLLDEEFSTKVYPTVVRGSTFHVQIGQPFEKLQVVNSANQAVYERQIKDQTGTITIGLPALPTGVYFVRLISVNQPQHVQKIVVE